MPTLTAASGKGGASKTTQLMVIADRLLSTDKIKRINIIDADEKCDLSDWVSEIDPDSRKKINLIKALSPSAFVDAHENLDPTEITLVDLEGSSNELVTTAIRLSHLVMLPMTPSSTDARQAFKTLGNIKMQQKASLNGGVERHIPRIFTLGRTKTVVTKAEKAIISDIAAVEESLLPVRLLEYVAYEAMGACGATLANLPIGGETDVTAQQRDKAIKNADEFVKSVMNALQQAYKK